MLLLEIERADVAWRNLKGLETRLAHMAQIVPTRLPTSLRCAGGVTLLLTGDRQLKELNHAFRKKNTPTNVLSFPQFSPNDLKPAIRKHKASLTINKKTSSDFLYLGDIAVAWQTVKAEAGRDQKTVIDHTTHLVIHGILHLFGYDHLCAEEAEKMEALECNVMYALGLKNPYLTPPCAATTAPRSAMVK